MESTHTPLKTWIAESADLRERRACETTFHASFLISVSQPAAASQQQPASCSQPASPASQPSQPANVASGHRSLRPPAIRHRCLQTLNKGHPIGCRSPPQPATARHRVPQPATWCQTFWHPQHQGGSQTCHKPIKYRRYGQRTTLGRPFQAFRAPTKIL